MSIKKVQIRKLTTRSDAPKFARRFQILLLVVPIARAKMSLVVKSSREIALVVPRDALVLRNNGSFVFRVSDGNVAEQIEIEVGDSSSTAWVGCWRPASLS